MKKALMHAHVASMIYAFNMRNIDILQKLGYQVDVVCNFGKDNPLPLETTEEFKKMLKQKGVEFYDIDCPRSINIKRMCNCYKQLRKLAKTKHYDLIHTQSLASFILRYAFRNQFYKGTKILSQEHGIYFYKGGPLKSWLMFYPAEKFCAKYTDLLVTINKDDYELAKNKRFARKVEFVPGVGIDTEKFSEILSDDELLSIRKSLGVDNTQRLLFSVGELNANKNHETVIKALSKLNNPQLVYAIAGEGDYHDYLQNLINESDLTNNVKLLGYRSDVKKLYQAADIYILPSFREGLNVSLMEAMASGLPCVAGNIRGNRDLVDDNGGRLFSPDSIDELVKTLTDLINLSDFQIRMLGKYNQTKISDYSKESVSNKMQDIYISLMNLQR